MVFMTISYLFSQTFRLATNENKKYANNCLLIMAYDKSNKPLPNYLYIYNWYHKAKNIMH